MLTRTTASRILFALLGGFLSSLALPREGIWPLIFVSVALLIYSVRELKTGPAVLVGFVGGLAFYLSQIEWLSLYLGPVPWLALATLEAGIFAIGMAAISRVWSYLNGLNFGHFKTAIVALGIAVIWTAREWVSITLPYGGFPWSRLAQTQSESPLASWAYWGGLGWLTLVIAWLSTLALLMLVQRGTRASLAIGLVTSVALILVPILTKLDAAPQSGNLVIGSVQGNANAGLFANTKRGSILENHLSATKLLAGKPLADELDLVVWPENASDLSPFADAVAQQKIRDLVNDELHVPLVFGTITARGDQLFNSSILWEPGLGATDWYDKKRPVPFAEYVPDRDFWYQLAPDLIGLISHGYSFGERDGIFETAGTKAGALICFEIAVDDIGRDLVAQGAQVILSQTNNADFGKSDETFQQAAFAKLRAIETGRTVVNVSTVGVSAVYAPDGQVLDALPTFVPGAMVTEVPLRTSITPAMLWGRGVDLWINILALVLLALALTKAQRDKRRSLKNSGEGTP